ncbi:hypothetical protein TWF281_005165 [Arthrobotrys megalospora]
MHIISLSSLLPLAGLVLQATAGPLTVLGAGSEDKIPNSYIVVLKPTTNQTQIQEHTHRITNYHSARSLEERGTTTGIRSHFSIDSVGPSFKGYNVECDSRTLREILSSPEVEYVEQDGKTSAHVTQKGSTWGLSRISWKIWNLPWPYTYRYQSTWAGRGTTVYVADTGVRTSHREFEGRATFGYNAVGGRYNTDRNGHGTHVAGTVAGKTYGVAKLARIVSVKVLNDKGDGSDSLAIAGLNWIGRRAKAGKSVVNMSLGGRKSKTLNDAVEALYRRGIIVVVSAGNNGLIANNYSPASAPNAITVGAIDDWNFRAYFSNYGSRVDVFAPGVDILSAWWTSDTATRYLDGTSQAAPHVAGLAAYFISSKASYQSPLTIANRIIATSQKGTIWSVGAGSPNRLAYNGYS